MPRAEAITEVTNADDIADLRWWQQGDKHLETAAVLEERHANRNDPDVRRALSKWWDAALAGDFSATLRHADGEVSIDMHNLEGGQLQRLDKRRYVDILTKIGLASLCGGGSVRPHGCDCVARAATAAEARRQAPSLAWPRVTDRCGEHNGRLSLLGRKEALFGQDR